MLPSQFDMEASSATSARINTAQRHPNMSPPAHSYDNAPQDQLYHYGLSDNQHNTSHTNAPPDDEYPINSIIPRPLPALPVSTLLDRLQKLEQVRPIPWRAGQELPPDKSTHSSRVQQRGATLLSTRGVVSNPPCQSCASGNGRFSVCVTADNWFRGACASCLFTSKGNRCSLRRERSGEFSWKSRGWALLIGM